MPKVLKTRLSFDKLYTLEVDDYPIHDADFDKISRAGQSIWKDFLLASGPLSLALLINALTELTNQTTFTFTIPLFINSLLGIVSLVSALVFYVLWRKDYQSSEAVIEEIKARTPSNVKETSSH